MKYRYPKIQNWNTHHSMKTQLDIKALKRDKNKCRNCGKEKKLHVHHLKKEICPGIKD